MRYRGWKINLKESGYKKYARVNKARVNKDLIRAKTVANITYRDHLRMFEYNDNQFFQ